MKSLIQLAVLLLTFTACEGPVGPPGERGERGEQGERGFQGEPGLDLEVQEIKGTVHNRNYTDANPRFASIPLGEHSSEPTVLFLGIENENGVFVGVNPEFFAVIWGGDDPEFSVPGTSGFYFFVYDRYKDLVGSNYQVKFVI